MHDAGMSHGGSASGETQGGPPAGAVASGGRRPAPGRSHRRTVPHSWRSGDGAPGAGHRGPSGGVGTFAVQLAAVRGLTVSGVCSTRNVDLVASLGATHLVDYTRDDFTGAERSYDVVLDLVGNRACATCAESSPRAAGWCCRRRQPGRGPVPWSGRADGEGRDRRPPSGPARADPARGAGRSEAHRSRRNGRPPRDPPRHRPHLPARRRRCSDPPPGVDHARGKVVVAM
jgi:Zinc-binding dehydrogenase